MVLVPRASGAVTVGTIAAELPVRQLVSDRGRQHLSGQFDRRTRSGGARRAGRRSRPRRAAGRRPPFRAQVAGDWGRYGVSAFLAADAADVDVLCETRLERFATVVASRRQDLVAAGIEVAPTFRAPLVGHKGHCRTSAVTSYLQQQRGAPAAQPMAVDQPVQDGAGRAGGARPVPDLARRLARMRRRAREERAQSSNRERLVAAVAWSCEGASRRGQARCAA